MTAGPDVLRYTAFADVPTGGNRAGIVLDAGAVNEAAMLAIAASVGYSETAFLRARDTPGAYDVRYFSPAIEVPFCGHATIASAVALVESGSPAELVFHTQSGEIPINVDSADGRPMATLTSVMPSVEAAPHDAVNQALQALGWSFDDVDGDLPPRVAFAGARHLVLALRSRQLLASMSYDFERLRTVMADAAWTTVQLVWRERPTEYHVRAPFAVGGVVEDPATGAGAAALGAYLRVLELVDPPVEILVHQGEDMGRPSRLTVGIDPGDGGIRVSGTALRLSEGHW